MPPETLSVADQEIYQNQSAIDAQNLSRSVAKLYFDTMVEVAKEKGKTRIEFPVDSDGTIVAHTWGKDQQYCRDNEQYSNLEFFGYFLTAVKANDPRESGLEARVTIASNQWGSQQIASTKKPNAIDPASLENIYSSLGIKYIGREYTHTQGGAQTYGSKGEALKKILNITPDQEQSTMVVPIDDEENPSYTTSFPGATIIALYGTSTTSADLVNKGLSLEEAEKFVADLKQGACLKPWDAEQKSKENYTKMLSDVQEGGSFGFCPSSALLHIIKMGKGNTIPQEIIAAMDCGNINALGKKAAVAMGVATPREINIDPIYGNTGENALQNNPEESSFTLSPLYMNSAELRSLAAVEAEKSELKDVASEVDIIINKYNQGIAAALAKRTAPIKGFVNNLRNIFGGVTRKQKAEASKMEDVARKELFNNAKVLVEDLTYDKKSFSKKTDANGFVTLSPLELLASKIGHDSSEMDALRASANGEMKTSQEVTSSNANVREAWGSSEPVVSGSIETSAGADNFPEAPIKNRLITLLNEKQKLFPGTVFKLISEGVSAGNSVANFSINGLSVPMANGKAIAIDAISYETMSTKDTDGVLKLWIGENEVFLPKENRQEFLKNLCTAVEAIEEAELLVDHPFSANSAIGNVVANGRSTSTLDSGFEGSTFNVSESGICDALLSNTFGQEHASNSKQNRYFKLDLSDSESVVIQVDINTFNLKVANSKDAFGVNKKSGQPGLKTSKQMADNGKPYVSLENSEYRDRIKEQATQSGLILNTNVARNPSAVSLAGPSLSQVSVS